jgi:hypothetical protein
MVAADFNFRIISAIFAELCSYFNTTGGESKAADLSITHCFNEGICSGACKVGPNMRGSSI